MKNCKTKSRLNKFIVNIPHLSIVLPYLDYAHSCVYLMTNLCSKSRKLYLSNEKAFNTIILKNNKMEIDCIKVNRNMSTDMLAKCSKLFRFGLMELNIDNIDILSSVLDNNIGTFECITGWEWPFKNMVNILPLVIIANYFTKIGIQNREFIISFKPQDLIHFKNEKFTNKKILKIYQNYDIEKEKQFFFENLDKFHILADINDAKEEQDIKSEQIENEYIRQNSENIKNVTIYGCYNSIIDLSKLKRKGIKELNQLLICDISKECRIKWSYILKQISDIKSYTYSIQRVTTLVRFEIQNGQIFCYNTEMEQFHAYSFESLSFQICNDAYNLYIHCIEDNMIALNNICAFEAQSLAKIQIDDNTRKLLNKNEADLNKEDCVIIQSFSKFKVSMSKESLMNVKFDSINIIKDGAYIKDNKIIVLKPQDIKKNHIEIYIPDTIDQDAIDFSINIFNLDVKNIVVKENKIKEDMLVALFSQNNNTLLALDISIKNLKNARDVLKLCNSKSNLKKICISTALKDFQNIVREELKRSYIIRIVNYCVKSNSEELKYSDQFSQQETTEELEFSDSDSHEEIIKEKSEEKQNSQIIEIKYEIIFNI